MQNGHMANAPISARLQQVIDGIKQPDGPAYDRAMYIFNERANELADRVMGATGKASENDLADLNGLLEFFANEGADAQRALSFEMKLSPEIVGGFSPCQRAMWAFACHALASRRLDRSDT